MAERGKSTGSGFGGSVTDKKQRLKGKKEALRREKGTWSEWQKELRDFMSKHQNRGATIAASGQSSNREDDLPVLNTLKQVLRCQAPDWWWKGPQRGMYLLALKVSIVITEQYPKAWGDPEDTESAIVALEELAETSKILVSSVLASSKVDHAVAKRNNSNDIETTNAYDLIKNQTEKISKQNTNDKEMLLPKAVIQLKDKALAASKAFLEQPECSMMGIQDYYCQKLRPLAFAVIAGECFENPKHATFGVEPEGNKKTGKNNQSIIRASSTVLWKELSTYPTALPIEYGSSIFVRAMESALDKLRVLIIGPEDTPYANGCFLFDVTMGNDYPNKPPHVRFLTTSSFHPNSRQNNRVRFNPNLYADGKVCLSLLGTWNGPSWTPNESTLLQVLVSLQSLILGVTNPFFNEPGYESNEGTIFGDLQSKAYNKNIRRHTLGVAILPFLQNQLDENASVNSGGKTCTVGPDSKSTPASPKEKRKISKGSSNQQCYFAEFKEVVEEHFRLKKQVIRKQLNQWLQEDKGLLPLHSEFVTVSDQLEEQQQQRVLSASLSKRSRTTRKVTSTTATMPVSLSFTTKDGSILLDDDDDEQDLQRALKNSMNTIFTDSRARSGSNDTEVIDLIDSDDNDDGDEMERTDQKPAATVVIVDTSDSIGNDNRNKSDPTGDGGELTPEAGTVRTATENVIEITDSDDERQSGNVNHPGGEGTNTSSEKIHDTSVVDLID